MSTKRRFCQLCRAEIPGERIEVMPETRICVQCSQKTGGEFEVRATPENLGKAGSLKKNYGGLNIVKRRRRLEP
jgi:hypothetical protein